MLHFRLSFSPLYIQRFSEDIDLILDWRILGYGFNEPWEERSNTKQDIFNKNAHIRVGEFLINKLLPEMINDLTLEIGHEINIFIDSDLSTIKILYPNCYTDLSILREIRLEIGALAAWTPAKVQKIISYAAQEYGWLFLEPSTEILTVLPERTFFEKITILHKEAFRAENKPFPTRYSRHYYDVYRMIHTDVKDKAMKDISLLNKVVDFKKKFYRCPWAKYDLVNIGCIKLVPPKYNLDKLRLDYEHMKKMIFGDIPSFDKIMKEISIFEKEINLIILR